MDNYIYDLGTGSVQGDVTFDVSAFDDIEITEVVNEIKDAKLDPLLNIMVGGSIFNKPIADNGVVYFGCCDKKFYAINTEGKLVWKFDTNGVVVSSPCFVGNLVVFGSFDYNLYALDRETGNLTWKFHTNGKVYSYPCTDGERIYFGSEDGNLYCIDRNGSLLWKFGTGGPIETHPMLHEGVVYFGSNDHNLYALDASSGTLLWKFAAKSNIRHGFAFWDDVIYFSAMENMIYGVNTKGSQVFSFLMNDTGSNTLLATNGILYICSRDNYLYAVRIGQGLLWKFRTEHAVEEPVFHDGVLYFTSEDQNIYAVSAETGSLVWKYDTGGMLPSTPLVHEGVVYLGGWDCNMYALNAETGTLLWKFATSMSTQSKIEMEKLRPQKNFEVVWVSDKPQEKEKKREEIPLSDYGNVVSDYAAGMSKDYVKGKKGYMS